MMNDDPGRGSGSGSCAPICIAARANAIAQAQRVAHLTLQPLEHDARVARAVSALKEAGREIVLIAPGHGFAHKPMDFRRKLMTGLSFALGGRLGRAGARAAFWAVPPHRAALLATVSAEPEAIHAHDWDGLVIGARAAGILGVPLIYDAHEFAPEMHMERRLWSLTMRPAIARLEAEAIRSADAVIAVSCGLAAVMNRLYPLRRAPVVVRNMPEVPPVPYVARPQRHDSVLVHYHGVLAEGRGLLRLVRAIALMPPRFKLRLTGPWCQARFKRALLNQISESGVGQRVELIPPLPFRDLVAHASEADIGVVLLSGTGRHDRFALPNKVFEYVHAGLCLLSPAHSLDIARIITEYRCGITIADRTPEAVAAGLENLDRTAIDGYRQAAHQAADTLCWHRESQRLLALYGYGDQSSKHIGA